MIITERLLALRDEKYAEFTARLIPTVDPSRIIGVRAPQLRQLANELRKMPEAENFLSILPHHYLEEYGLHALLLERIKDYNTALKQVDRLLPFVDNWATCDTLSPHVFSHHTDTLLPQVERWMASTHEYTCRYGIGILMRYYLDDNNFRPEHLVAVARIEREEYYIRMMQAWYFATALAKQWDAALAVVPALPEWVRRKTIQKACESFRVSKEHKEILRGLR